MSTPFKMKGFSGFVNSPLKQTGHSPDLSSGGLMRSRGGGLRSKTKKRKRSKGNLGYQFLRFLGLNKGSKQKPNLKFWCSGKDC